MINCIDAITTQEAKRGPEIASNAELHKLFEERAAKIARYEKLLRMVASGLVRVEFVKTSRANGVEPGPVVNLDAFLAKHGA